MSNPSRPTNDPTLMHHYLQHTIHSYSDVVVPSTIHSYFLLATTFISKLKELENEKQKVILVVDDEPLTIQLIEEYLYESNLSCRILSARNGQAAYSLAISNTPDLIITDLIMPDYDGLELIKHLKTNVTTKSIPIILTTGAYLMEEEINTIL